MKSIRELFSACKYLLALGALSITIITGCDGSGGENRANASAKKPNQSKAAKSVPVEVASPSIAKASAFYLTTATISPSSDANINARTGGVVQEIFHEEGDDVRAGDSLLKLQDDDQKLRLQQAQQQLLSAEREYNRLSKMKQAGVVSPNEWETAFNNFAMAKTELELAELALSYTNVEAPFDGRVVWREVDLGEHVNTGSLLFRMMAINPLLIRVHIPANRIGKVAVGQKVEVRIDSINQWITATIDLVSPIVDPSTGTIKVTLRVDEYPTGVRPGDFADVKIVTDTRENALMLPSTAIIEERGKHFVFIDSQGEAAKQSVEIGFVVEDKTEIISGISAQDKVIVKGQRNLKEGTPLKIMASSQSGLTHKDATSVENTQSQTQSESPATQDSSRAKP